MKSKLIMFNKVVDYFIHPQLKIDESLHEKAKVNILAFFIIFGMGLMYNIFYWAQGFFWGEKSFHNYLGITLGIAGPIIIKKTGNPNLALALGAIIGAYLITASVYLSGGINSNDVLWYAILSAASFMFIGTKVGLIMSVISSVCITIFYVLDTFNIIKFEAHLVSLSLSYRYYNLMLILGVLTLMVYVLVRGNNKLQKVIQLSKEQKVREEIARDFHDQIGNKLASIKHLSELIKTNNDQFLISDKIGINAKEVYDNFRDFIWTLDAKSDCVDELFMYLRDFADDYFKFSEIKLYINSNPELLPNTVVPNYISKEIVLIFKEALTNVFKHSKAKNVYLNFVLLKNELQITLKDDGIGIKDSVFKNGNGLKNMRYRAQKAGGVLTIESSNIGTTALFEINLTTLKG